MQKIAHKLLHVINWNIIQIDSYYYDVNESLIINNVQSMIS